MNSKSLSKDCQSYRVNQDKPPINYSKDIDSESGIASIQTRSSKVASSETNDDESPAYSTRTNSLSESDDAYRRPSDASSITNFSTRTVSEFPSSSCSSGLTTPTKSMSMLAISSKQSLAAPLDIPENTKSKGKMKNFFQKLFGSTSSSSTTTTTTTTSSTNEMLNIDHVNGTAYPPMRPLPITQGPIRLFVIRHGERIDRYYSSQWLQQAFDKDENYCRFSPILPETMPFRASFRDYDLDPPLTYKGLKDAFHTGTRLREKGIHIHYCYSSPALRCIQTAAKIIEGLQLQNKLKIRIEPGLFECTAWYTLNETSDVITMPKFMTKKELIENKFSIDKNYHEQMNLDDISQFENELEFYERSHVVAASILKSHENELIQYIQQGQVTPQHHLHVLFIAHAPTLETCTRKLCGGKFRPNSLGYVIRNVDFLTMTVIEKTDNNADKWIFRRNSFYGDEF